MSLLGMFFDFERMKKFAKSCTVRLSTELIRCLYSHGEKSTSLQGLST